jgi:hypothetical protein
MKTCLALFALAAVAMPAMAQNRRAYLPYAGAGICTGWQLPVLDGSE